MPSQPVRRDSLLDPGAKGTSTYIFGPLCAETNHLLRAVTTVLQYLHFCCPSNILCIHYRCCAKRLKRLKTLRERASCPTMYDSIIGGTQQLVLEAVLLPFLAAARPLLPKEGWSVPLLLLSTAHSITTIIRCTSETVPENFFPVRLLFFDVRSIF